MVQALTSSSLPCTCPARCPPARQPARLPPDHRAPLLGCCRGRGKGAGQSHTHTHKLLEYTVFPRSVAATTINFSFTEVRRLFEGGVYSRAVFILPTGLPPAYPSTFSLNATSKDLFFASAIVRLWSSRARQSRESSLSHVDNVAGSAHLRMRMATVHMNMINAATVQGRPLLRSARVLCGAYSRAAFIWVWRLFKEIR